MRLLQPIKLGAIRKEYIWGTEDWVLSDLHDEVEHSELLVKIITARENLSVQVHPGNEYALEKENSTGKTEMWYVLDCEPGAFLYYGLKHKISASEFLKRIKNDTILEVCQKVSVKKGDVFYIPAGLIHAIGKGIKVAEVQQNSNITYRVYDYHRQDDHHNFRPLHIKQAEEVAGFMPPLMGHHPMGVRKAKEGYYKTLLVRCPYFQVERIEIETVWKSGICEKEQSLLILGGGGKFICDHAEWELKAGDSIYIPKKTASYEIKGKVQVLLSKA